MKKYDAVVLLSLAVFALSAVSSLQAADRMRSGQWEATVTAGGQTSTNTHCISPEQVKTANGSREEIRASLEKSAASLHCTLDDFKIEEKTVSYVYSCPGKSTQSKTFYNGDSYVTILTLKTGSQVKTSEFRGRRLGACPSGS